MADDPNAPGLRTIARGVEERLRELHEAGELADLPGEGAPLPPDPDEGADEDWAARHVVRTAGARPAWAELRQEIADERARLITRLRRHLGWLAGREALLGRLPAERIVSELTATRASDERVRAEIVAAVADVNVLVARYNLMVTPVLHLAVLSADSLTELARRRASAP